MKSQNSPVMSESTFMKVLAILFLIFAMIMITEPAHAQSGNVYGRDQAQGLGLAQEGVVLQVAVKSVEAGWQARAVGAALGSAVGYSAARNNANFGLMAMLGGLAGERIANATSQDQAQEILIQMKAPNGGSQVVSVVQPAPFDMVHPGDNVLVVSNAGRVRVIKQQVVIQQPPQAAPAVYYGAQQQTGTFNGLPVERVGYFR